MIPKVIHYCWLGGKPLPESAVKCIESWKRVMPSARIVEWNETNYDFNKISYMAEARSLKKWGFVPDYARLDIIYNEGGIYLDTDVELLKPLDPLLQNKAFCGFETDAMVNLGQGFAAEKGDQIIKVLRDSYDGMHFINPDGSQNLVASPTFQTRDLIRLGLRADGTLQRIGSLTVYPKEYFNPIDVSTGKLSDLTDNTYSIHHFAASWFPLKQRVLKWICWHIGLTPCRIVSLLLHNPFYIVKRIVVFFRTKQ